MKMLCDILILLPIAATGLLLLFRCLREGGLRPVGRHQLRADAPSRMPYHASQKELWAVWGLAILLRLLVLLISELCVRRAGLAEDKGLFGAWVRWDATHYVNLSRLGYAGYLEDGTPLFLVFFPLYAWLLRAVGLLIRSPAAAGVLISSLCYAFGCRRLYAFTAESYGKPAAQRSVLFLSVFPFAFFFGGVMTEGLFFLTTVSALYELRRRRWLTAGIWGALAAMTRMQGVLLIVAAVAELLAAEQPLAWSRQDWRERCGKLLSRLPLLLLPLLGTGVYLFLNYRVTGNAFAFLEMQKHWYQGLYPVSGTLQYVFREAVNSAGEAIAWQTWWPQLILFPLFLATLALSHRRVCSAELCYGFAYLVISYSLSWLLSGGRYLSCDVPVFLCLGVLTEKKPALTLLLTLAMSLLFVVYLRAYLSGGYIM